MKQKDRDKIIKKTVVGGVLGATMGYLSTSKSNPKSGTMTKDRLENMKSLTSQLLNQQAKTPQSKRSRFKSFKKDKAAQDMGTLFGKLKKGRTGERKGEKAMEKTKINSRIFHNNDSEDKKEDNKSNLIKGLKKDKVEKKNSTSKTPRTDAKKAKQKVKEEGSNNEKANKGKTIFKKSEKSEKNGAKEKNEKNSKKDAKKAQKNEKRSKITKSKEKPSLLGRLKKEDAPKRKDDKPSKKDKKKKDKSGNDNTLKSSILNKFGKDSSDKKKLKKKKKQKQKKGLLGKMRK